jgi:hypothetical protein
VLAELARYDPRKHYLFFYDDNFTSNPRRAKELLKEAGCQVPFIGFDADTPTTTRCTVDYDWETYDGHHVKFQPRHFSPWELQKAQIVAHIRFFRLGRVFRRLLSGSGRAWVIGLYAHGISRRWLHWENPYLRRLLGCVTSISRALREPAPGLWRAPRAQGAPSAPR